MENENMPQLPKQTPVFPGPKKSYQHKGVTIIIYFAVVAAVLVSAYFVLNQPMDLGPIVIPQHQHTTIPMQAKPNLKPVFNDRILQICSGNNEKGGFVPGQVMIMFKDGLSVKQVNEYLNKNNFQIIDGSELAEPSFVKIQWTSSFLQKNSISLEEVNQFLDNIEKESFVKQVDISQNWHTYPVTDKNHIQVIDRWGYFTLTFSDGSKIQDFLNKYPDATLLTEGSLEGEYAVKPNNATKITILYKGKDALDQLFKIKKDNGLTDGAPEDEFYYGIGAKRQRLVVYVNETGERNVSDTNFVSELYLNLPSQFDSTDAKNIIDSFPQISANSFPGLSRLDNVTISVPIGQEECWAKQIEKDPEVDGAVLNVYMRLD